MKISAITWCQYLAFRFCINLHDPFESKYRAAFICSTVMSTHSQISLFRKIINFNKMICCFITLLQIYITRELVQWRIVYTDVVFFFELNWNLQFICCFHRQQKLFHLFSEHFVLNDQFFCCVSIEMLSNFFIHSCKVSAKISKFFYFTWADSFPCSKI